MDPSWTWYIGEGMSSDSTPEILIVEVTDLSRAGSGVAREPSGRVIFIPYTAPGDRVRIRVVDADRRYAQGELVEILRPSPERVKPPCPVFGRCGGCQWQHLPYERQWRTKVQGVVHALARVGVELPNAPLDELSAERIWGYRNRIQLRGSGGALGFYASGTHELVPVDRCEIARPELNARWPELRAEATGLCHADRADRRGLGDREYRKYRKYKVELEVLEDGRVVTSWNRRHAAMGFRQVHDEQNAKLQSWVREAITPGRPVLDLFGGQGNLSRSLAGVAPEIHCVDLTAPSERPEDAPPELFFHRAPVLPWLARRSPDSREGAAILDPPRAGLAQDFIEIASRLEKLGVVELVAVGCDADAWARDLSRFARRGWRLERIGVLDLFPQTPHVEGLGLLRRG